MDQSGFRKTRLKSLAKQLESLFLAILLVGTDGMNRKRPNHFENATPKATSKDFASFSIKEWRTANENSLQEAEQITTDK